MDHLLPAQRSAMMRSVRRSGSSLERKVRSKLTNLGYRYRVNLSGLPGTPDLAFTKRRCAIFVHGCFWHGHSCKLSRIPTTRREFWLEKITKNKQRDLIKEDALRGLGWRVLTVWQCEMSDAGLDSRLADFLGPARWTAKSDPQETLHPEYGDR